MLPPVREALPFHVFKHAECGNHRLATGELSAALICSVLTQSTEPHDDDAGQDAKHDLEEDGGEEPAHAASTFGLQNHAVDKVPGDTGEEDNECVDHALNQREGHHVAVCDVSDFVSDDCLGFALVHLRQEAGAYSNERIVPVPARRECIGWTLKNGHFGIADFGFCCQTVGGFEYPSFCGIARCFDHPCASGSLCDELGHEE